MSDGPKFDGPVFVVGFPRSGTTLLNAMLSLHPRLAVAHEWRFVPDLLRPRPDGTIRTAVEVFGEALAAPKLGGEPVDAAWARRRLAEIEDPVPADGVRCLFEAYAHAVGKPRWGDKTPRNLVELDLLATAFPDACFVHLVRDGREVADANRDAPWGGSGLLLWASRWAAAVGSARAAGARLGERYLEVRYEHLVAEPAQAMAEVCAFLGESFQAEQLDYSGAILALGSDLPAHHRNLLLPPTPGLRDWRTEWSRRDRVAVEALIGPALEQLGYPRSVPTPAGWRHRTGGALAGLEGMHNAVQRAWRENQPSVRGVARRLLPGRLRP